MKKRMLVILTLIMFITVSSYAGPYFLLGKLYDATGNSGTAVTENSFASIIAYRDMVIGEKGEQNNGPDEDYRDRIFPAWYNNVTTSAYAYTDVGSSDWLTAAVAGQLIRSVYEVYEPDNGWAGETYLATIDKIITAAEVTNSETFIGETQLVELPAPVIASEEDSSIIVSWTGIDLDSVVGYVLYRKQEPSGTYSKINGIPQDRGNSIEYEDNFGLAIGATYSYKLAVYFSWVASDEGSYETRAKSKASTQAALDVPTQTITPTPTITQTSTVTMTITPTETPVNTPAPPALLSNIQKEKFVVFNNPIRDNKLKIGFDSPGAGTAHIYLYNVFGETGKRITMPVSPGVNLYEEAIKQLSSGVYVLRITIKTDKESKTLPIRKVAIIR